MNLGDPFGLQADTVRYARCEVAKILGDYIEALSDNPGKFAAAFRTGAYPSDFDFKTKSPALYQVGDKWLRNDEFGNFAAGYAAEYTYDHAGALAMFAGGVAYARERNQHGERVSGEHWSDWESWPMINAGVARAWLDHPSLPVAGMHGSGRKPRVGPSLLSTAGCAGN